MCDAGCFQTEAKAVYFTEYDHFLSLYLEKFSSATGPNASTRLSRIFVVISFATSSSEAAGEYMYRTLPLMFSTRLVAYPAFTRRSRVPAMLVSGILVFSVSSDVIISPSFHRALRISASIGLKNLVKPSLERFI